MFQTLLLPFTISITVLIAKEQALESHDASLARLFVFYDSSRSSELLHVTMVPVSSSSVFLAVLAV